MSRGDDDMKEHYRTGWTAPYVGPKLNEYVPSMPAPLPGDNKWRNSIGSTSSNPFDEGKIFHYY